MYQRNSQFTDDLADNLKKGSKPVNMESDHRQLLEDLLNTADQDIRRYFEEAFLQEVQFAQDRAMFRTVREYRHRLPIEPFSIVDQAVSSLSSVDNVLAQQEENEHHAQSSIFAR